MQQRQKWKMRQTSQYHNFEKKDKRKDRFGAQQVCPSTKKRKRKVVTISYKNGKQSRMSVSAKSLKGTHEVIGSNKALTSSICDFDTDKDENEYCTKRMNYMLFDAATSTSEMSTKHNARVMNQLKLDAYTFVMIKQKSSDVFLHQRVSSTSSIFDNQENQMLYDKDAPVHAYSRWNCVKLNVQMDRETERVIWLRVLNVKTNQSVTLMPVLVRRSQTHALFFIDNEETRNNTLRSLRYLSSNEITKPKSARMNCMYAREYDLKHVSKRCVYELWACMIYAKTEENDILQRPRYEKYTHFCNFSILPYMSNTLTHKAFGSRHVACVPSFTNAKFYPNQCCIDLPEQWHGWKQTFQMHPAIEQMFKTRERNTIESKPQSTVI